MAGQCKHNHKKPTSIELMVTTMAICAGLYFTCPGLVPVFLGCLCVTMFNRVVGAYEYSVRLPTTVAAFAQQGYDMPQTTAATRNRAHTTHADTSPGPDLYA